MFGLQNEDIRTELLNSHCKADGAKKTLADVTREAKAHESAVKANRMIEERTKTDEHVNWSGQKRFQRHNQPPQQQSRHTSRQQHLERRAHSSMKLKRQPGTCHWCGDQRGPHPWRICPANGKTCKRCGVNDHFARVCLETPIHSISPLRHPRSTTVNEVRANSHMQHLNYSNEDDDCAYSDYTGDAFAVDPHASATTQRRRVKGQRYFANLALSTTGSKFKHIKLQIDTAATCNTISLRDASSLSKHLRLRKSLYVLHPYGNSNPIRPVGEADLVCERNNQFYTLTFQVLPDDVMKGKPALLSGTDSVRLGLVKVSADEIYQLKNIPKAHFHEHSHHTVPSMNARRQNNLPIPGTLARSDVLKHFGDVFKGLGYLGPPVSFKVDPNVTPINMPVHRIPVTKRDKEKETLKRYEDAGILVKVDEPTPWCSNELIRETPKKFRVCIDPSQTVNKAILRPIHQLPILNEQLHRLSNAKCFSLVDAKEGFLQCPLDEESSLMTTMHTSFGRYRWLRLPFGISSAPEEFQRRLMNALEGLSGIICIADDILVFGEGKTIRESEINHDERMLALMERCREKNLKLNPEKLRFKVNEVKFMGNIITDRGMKADPDKVEAITKLPSPENKADLLRIIGMMNYLSPFCKNLSSIIFPLRALTKDGVSFQWSSIQEEALTQAKNLVSSAPTLMYYDLKKPVVLQVDASANGLGGALLQPNDENKFQRVAVTSSSMSDTESRYSQIEKECLAICKCFQKFDQWLYGKQNVEVHTDHKPLEMIIQKPLNKAPARLQRMLMKLQRYQFTLKYKPGPTMYIADTLSRAALPHPISAKVTGFEVFRMTLEQPEETRKITAPTLLHLKEETHKDEVLSQLYILITNGWPTNKHQVPESISPYWSYRDELSIQDGVIYKGCSVLVPPSMIPQMLKKIHASHLGAESNIRIAKEVLFWSGMRDI